MTDQAVDVSGSGRARATGDGDAPEQESTPAEVTVSDAASETRPSGRTETARKPPKRTSRTKGKSRTNIPESVETAIDPVRESGRDRHPEPEPEADPVPAGVTDGGGSAPPAPTVAADPAEGAAPAEAAGAAPAEATGAEPVAAPEPGIAPEAVTGLEPGTAPRPGAGLGPGPGPVEAAAPPAASPVTAPPAAPLVTAPPAAPLVTAPAEVRPSPPLLTPDPVPPRSGARPSGERPPDDHFFGRQRELKALHGDIERAGLNTISGRKEPRARVLLIAGRPGSGRTALARELAGQLAPGYPDGVVRARLTEAGGAPVPTERTAREILGVFGVATPPGAGEDELSEMVREALAVRRVLLLLDDAADAEQVDPLVPDNPGCLVVAVAQGPLTGVPDVRPCTLGGMDAKAAIELLARFAGSVRITVDPQAAESLAEECGGQPAALVLAGGWLAARPTASVADAAKRLRALPYDTDLPVGDRPLARAFQLVYESLPGPAARILRLLALAPGGLADAHTASALAGCSVSAAGVTLDDFTVRGLLHRADDPTPDPGPLDFGCQDAGATAPQYVVPGCLVPLLRAVMEHEDRPAEVQLARARMLERTVRLLQSCRAVTDPEGSAARRRLAGLPRALRFPHAGAADAWLYSRRPALLACARLAVADGELDTLARRLVAALVRALAAHRGTEAAAPELYGLHQLVLDIAERRGLHRERAAALLNIGDLDARTGRTHDALARYRAALDAGREAGDLYATGRAMESIGGAHQDLGDWQRAADWYGRALSQRLSRGERADEARLHGRLGTVHTYAGRYGEALRNWRAAAALHRRLQDLPGLARTLSEAARVQEYAGRPQESLRTCQEAVEWARRAEDVRLQAALQLRLADTLDRLGDPTAARLHRATSERLLETEGKHLRNP